MNYGLLNLTHRESHEEPANLVPGERYRVRLALNHVAQVFPKGHSVRIAISTSYWPIAWPPPEPVKLEIATAVSRLTLPVRPPRAEDEVLRPFERPERAPSLTPEVVEPRRYHWTVQRDLAEDTSTLEVIRDEGTVLHTDIDLETSDAVTEWYRYRRKDFDSFSGETVAVRTFKRGDFDIRTETRTVVTCDANNFYVHATLDAYEKARRVFSRVWNRTIARKLV